MQINLSCGLRAAIYDEATSTMDIARQQADAPAAAGWFFAHHQTAARGRMGRAWQSPSGNFAATLLLYLNCTAQQAAQHSMVAACALHDALSDYVAAGRLKQKWPNDVLLDGRKLAGILLESSMKNGMVDRLSIGIGVNLAQTPAGIADAQFAPIGLTDVLDAPIEPLRFLDHLAGHMQMQLQNFNAYGFADIREKWLQHAAQLGQEIQAKTAQETLKGLFETINEDGNLVLNNNGCKTTIASADILF